MRRVLAVVGAVMIVALAVVVRGALDDDSEDDPSSGDPLVVACDPDLRAACEALAGVDVRVEDSSATAGALPGGEIDAWLTSSAWLEVAASRTPEAIGAAEALATSPVVVATDPDRADALRALCEDGAVWRCLAASAGQPWRELGGSATWGPLRTGLPDADTAAGLGVLASAAVGWFGGSDFAANDFAELRGPLSNLVEPSGGGDRNLLTTLVRVRGTYSAGGFTSAAVDGRSDVALLRTEPAVEVTAVMVELSGGDGAPDAAAVRATLADAGWRPASGEPGTMLKPGVMAALHTLWTEITR